MVTSWQMDFSGVPVPAPWFWSQFMPTIIFGGHISPDVCCFTFPVYGPDQTGCGPGQTGYGPGQTGYGPGQTGCGPGLHGFPLLTVNGSPGGLQWITGWQWITRRLPTMDLHVELLVIYICFYCVNPTYSLTQLNPTSTTTTSPPHHKQTSFDFLILRVPRLRQTDYSLLTLLNFKGWMQGVNASALIIDVVM